MVELTKMTGLLTVVYCMGGFLPDSKKVKFYNGGILIVWGFGIVKMLGWM